uniref:Uncharacterized protein n=1 Tax=Tanacetum cinerariifolium TaxID=118510 RepID=A0A6L2JLZ5_TANCI|nr:hypothetical protein [Tanacetum cinerariifolium]
MINLHTVRDDNLLGTLKFVSKTEDYPIYEAVIPDGMINEDIKLSKEYNTYLDYATGKVPPKKARKFKKLASPRLKTISSSPKEHTQKAKRVKRSAKKTSTTSAAGVVIRDTLDVSVSKKKGPAKANRGKGIELLSEEESDDVNDEYENDADNEEDDSDNYDCDNDDEDYKEEEQYEEFMLTPERNKSDDNDKMYEEGGDDVIKEFSSISSEFTSKLLNLDDLSPDINSLMNTSTVPPLPPSVYPSSHPIIIPQQQTLNSTSTTTYPTTNLTEIPNFASLFKFDQRVSALETKLYEFNQISQFAEAVSSIPGIVDNHLASKLNEEVNVVVQLQSNKLKEEAKAENQEFINQVDTTMKKIIKESTNQPQTSYAVAASLLEFNLKRILIDKMETNKSINRSDIQKNLYNALDEDPFAGPDRGTKRRKSSKVVEPSKSSKSKESKSSSSSKGTQYQYKSSGKSTQAEKLEFKAADIEMNQDQGNKFCHIDDQPDNEWYDYGYLEEIVVRRDDNVLYKFKEGDFPRLNLRDIEDMLLLLVQKKLSKLDVDDQYDLGVAL